MKQAIKRREAWLGNILTRPLQLPLHGQGVLKPGWRLEQQTIPEHLIYFIARNACVGRVGDSAVELSAGSLLWLPPGIPFELSLISPRRPITLLRFRLAIAGEQPAWRVPVVLIQAWELQPSIQSILDELSADLPYREHRLRAHLVALFAGIFRLQSQSADKRLTLSATECTRLTEYVAAHLSDWPGASDLAAHLRLSHDYFSRLFRRTFGVAPRLWIVRERIRHAANRLLDSNANASEVADELGYPDIFAFSRQFKKVMGQSPSAYRQTRSA